MNRRVSCNAVISVVLGLFAGGCGDSAGTCAGASCRDGAAGEAAGGGATGSDDGQSGEAAGGAGDDATAGGANETDAGAGGAAEAGGPCADPESLECLLQTSTGPWVVYVADEDAPGQDELYAIKLDLLDQMDPIKLSPELPADVDVGWLPLPPWSTDGSAYFFATQDELGAHLDAYVVQFGQGLPSAPLHVAGDFPTTTYLDGARWSPSGRSFQLWLEDSLIVVDLMPEGVRSTSVGPAEGGDWPYGFWKSDDELIHVEPDPAPPGELSGNRILRSVRTGDGWTTETLQDYEQPGFAELAPDGSSVVYSQRSDGLSTLLAVSPSAGAIPKQLAGPGELTFRWSPNGSRFLILNETIPQQRPELSLGIGPAHTATLVPLVLGDAVASGSAAGDFASVGFAPDNLRILAWERVADWGYGLFFYDPDPTGQTPQTRVPLTRAVADDEPVWSPSGNYFVMSDRTSATSDVALTAVVPSQGFTTLTIDSASSNHQYFSRFTDNGAFLVYGKWSDLEGDGGYVDLRGGLDSLPQASRLPGEGMLWAVEPVPGQSALLYIRQQEDGEQACQHLDLSGRLAAEPVQISRSGRVQSCLAQPAL